VRAAPRKADKGVGDTQHAKSDLANPESSGLSWPTNGQQVSTFRTPDSILIYRKTLTGTFLEGRFPAFTYIVGVEIRVVHFSGKRFCPFTRGKHLPG